MSLNIDFSTITLYDWVDFFGELCKKINEISQHKDRSTILKERTIKCFDNSDKINSWILDLSEVDPLSFIYTTAMKNSHNTKKRVRFFKQVKKVFEIEAKIPTDTVFPTPPFRGGHNIIFKSHSDQDIELYWKFFNQVYSNTINNIDFMELINKDSVKLPKLTQTMFLINPKNFFPIDSKFALLGGENYTNKNQLDSHVRKIENILKKDENGFTEYKKELENLSRKFTGCQFYEINIFSDLIYDDVYDRGKEFNVTDNYFIIGSNAYGGTQYKNNYISALYNKDMNFHDYNGVWVGGINHDRPFPITDPVPGDIILSRMQKTGNGIGIVINNEYKSAGGFNEDSIINVIWINKDERENCINSKQLKGFAHSYGTAESFMEKYPETREILQTARLWQKAKDKESQSDISASEDENIDKEEKSMKTYPLNLILYGPPGTGKTYHTKKIALDIINGTEEYFEDYLHDRIEFITFHQSYGYEEFVEGIRPVVAEQRTNEDGNNSAISYAIKKGAFREICDTAEKNSEQNYVLIIDEINRGNVSQIFGELITLIEIDKRAGNKHQLSVKLPYSGDSFSVPSNLYIIGTMNTADRSLVALDTALRRRFKFKEYRPNSGLVHESIRSAFKEMNNKIREEIDRDHEIGHSYFMNNNLDENELKTIFEQQIIPQLQEYFFDDTTNAKLKGILDSFFKNCREFKANDILDSEIYQEIFESNTNKSDS